MSHNNQFTDMRAVPNHLPNCRTVHSNRILCPLCRLAVVYFECTCGSKVFLELPKGGIHQPCFDLWKDGWRRDSVTREWVQNPLSRQLDLLES